ncbi:uncharacterized protein LOC121810389 [Salvia splendens]|uniref:uncharacterized protein LOC121810389 n=1 Tax=Salvia splendens TaxID=180675 RepID=UPI001C2589D7|nr:uncharacterized protein LOC121810389 [Salvia splendens]
MEGAEVEKKGSNECMEGYDRDRIPSSVFSRKSGTQWSGTSGDSLFSIHMGSSSFSNDYAIINDNKSTELPRLDEWPAPAHDHELSVSLPPVMEQEEGSLHSQESSSQPPNKHAISQTPVTPSISPTLNSKISDASNTSFAFPV